MGISGLGTEEFVWVQILLKMFCVEKSKCANEKMIKKQDMDTTVIGVV